jgi:hypothetical protein
MKRYGGSYNTISGSLGKIKTKDFQDLSTSAETASGLLVSIPARDDGRGT